jgi:hypothetical protein
MFFAIFAMAIAIAIRSRQGSPQFGIERPDWADVLKIKNFLTAAIVLMAFAAP